MRNEEENVGGEVVDPASVVLEGGKPLIPRKKKTKAKKGKEVATGGRPLPKGAVLLKTILAELGWPADGKMARRKLRAAGHDGQGDRPWHGHNERWVFDKKQAQKVREFLGEYES